MEPWIIRFAAALCAVGSWALFWVFGAFLAVPWREGRLLALSASEAQLLLVPLAIGAAVAWGAIHILAIADRVDRPAAYAAARAALLVMIFLAIAGGLTWSGTRIG